MATSTSSPPTGMSKPTSTPSRAKSPTRNPRTYFTTTRKANSPMRHIKSARIWQSRWLAEVVPMAISTTTATGICSSPPPTDPHISSETTVATARTWIKIQLVGQTSNRDGIGAQIRITSALGNTDTHSQERLELLLTERTHRHLRHKRRYYH